LSAPVDRTLQIERVVAPSHWLLGAKTLLLDRIVPQIERISLPPAVSAGGTIAIRYEGTTLIAPSRRSGLKALKHRLTTQDRPGTTIDGPFVDMRDYSPQNWSHALLIHAPLCQAAREALGVTPTVLFPANIPSYVVRAFELFGFPVVATDWVVSGPLCRVVPSSVDIMKNCATRLVAPLSEQVHAMPAGVGDAALPERIFVARKDTRAISNQAEIEALLAPLGYVTVYPERLSAPDQIRLFDRATSIVAVHGAALAPLAYRRASQPAVRLVEIMPAAHMTDFDRVIVENIGGKYIGVRGRITVADAAAAYRFGAPYVAHSLSNFEVDPETIALGLEMIEQ